MFCVECGNKIESKDKFCKVCGTRNKHYVELSINQVYAEPQPEVPVVVVKQETKEPLSNTQPQSEMTMVVPEQHAKESNTQPQPEILTGIVQPEIEASIEPQIHKEVAELAEIEEVVEVAELAEVDEVAEAEEATASEEISAKEMAMLIKPDLISANQNIDKPIKEVGIGIKVASVFLSVLAFIMTLLLISSLFAKVTLSTKTMNTALQKIDYTTIELSDILTENEMDIDIEEGDTTVDIIYEALSEHGNVDVSRGDVEEILEKATFSDYLSDKLSQYASYAVTGRKPDQISPREIVRLVEANEEIFMDVAGLEITPNDLDDLEKYLEEEDILKSISLDEIDRILEENNIEWIQKLLSNTTIMIILIASAVILLGILIWICYLHRRLKAPLSHIGIPVLIAGVIFALAMLVGNLIKANLFEEIENLYKSIKPMVSALFTRGIIIGVITSVIGFIMVFAYIMIKKADKRKQTIIKPIN
ncbi:MAG TPA: zinc ribbon domain-containing protein [Mobilitalea sp.]|nr:zinc ribbon domain-containing protein [Mobilitalea sp.]